jgi:hypothetical protein
MRTRLYNGGDHGYQNWKVAAMAAKKELTVRELAAMGGNARRDAMTEDERKASASKAAKARWAAVKKAAKKK